MPELAVSAALADYTYGVVHVLFLDPHGQTKSHVQIKRYVYLSSSVKPHHMTLVNIAMTQRRGDIRMIRAITILRYIDSLIWRYI